MYNIYKLTNSINGKIYIGQTKNFKQRMRQHKCSPNSKNVIDCMPIAKAIKQYGFENFTKEIIEVAETREEADEKEIYYINILNSTIEGNGYNVKLGGLGGKQLESTKRKIKNAQIGELNHMYGKRGADNKTSKKCINITTGIKYDSVTECAEKEATCISKIAAVCRGDRITHKKCVYRYLDDNGNIIEPNIKRKKRKTRKIKCIENDTIFDSYRDVKNFLHTIGINCTDTAIFQACRKSQGLYGYHFMYI